jgi:hypothetical protein
MMDGEQMVTCVFGANPTYMEIVTATYRKLRAEGASKTDARFIADAKNRLSEEDWKRIEDGS